MNQDLDDDALDAMLASLSREEPSPEFFRRVREIPLRHPRRSNTPVRAFLGALGLSSALAAGFLVGLAVERADSQANAETAELELDLAFADLSSEDTFDL